MTAKQYNALNPELLVNYETQNDSDKTFTVPVGEEWEILSVYALLVATATVGNRRIDVTLYAPGGLLIGRFMATADHAASVTQDYMFGPGLPQATVSGAQLASMPTSTVLPAGHSIQVRDFRANDAAADDLTVRIFGYKRQP